MNLFILALAPVFIILIYIYVRDKYEKEPISLLLKTLFLGIIITIPIIFTEDLLSSFYTPTTQFAYAFYNGFIVAAFTEEFFKWLSLLILIWRNKDFNERFDGIVYAVFISLGFAATENVLYVFEYGFQTGYLRAVTAVPAHALFGITMGYYFSLAKFETENTQINLLKAVLIPILLHGIYDFILMVEHPLFLLAFLPFLVYLWVAGFRKMKTYTRSQ